MGKSRGVKVIKKKIKSGSNTDVADLNKMFSQITGSSDPEREVIIPKINKIFRNIIEYNKLYNVLLNFTLFTEQFPDYTFWFDDIKTFLDNLIKTTGVITTQCYDDGLPQKYTALSDSALATFYKTLKENVCLKKIIITGSTLSAHKTHITTVDKLDDIFIIREPGLTLQPLAFSTLDLKTIWSFDINEKAKKFIMSILRHTYLIGIDTYDIVTSPDVDIKKFSKILVDSIAKMKQMIPRCDKAFGIIENSVQLLEDKFKGYFRGSVEAGNPNIIIESFIVDISTSQKASPVVTSQFRKIVSFLKERSAQNNDPKIKKLFSVLNSQFSVIDTELGVKTETEPETKTESVIEPLLRESTKEEFEQQIKQGESTTEENEESAESADEQDSNLSMPQGDATFLNIMKDMFTTDETVQSETEEENDKKIICDLQNIKLDE